MIWFSGLILDVGLQHRMTNPNNKSLVNHAYIVFGESSYPGVIWYPCG